MRIIETSKEYHARKNTRDHASDCPECGYGPNFGVYHIESKGFWNMKLRHINTVRCMKCGCEFEYADEWV